MARSCPYMLKLSPKESFFVIITDMSYQLVILAAGKGTRMGSEIPKVLIPLAGKPVITYLLEEVAKISQNEKPVVVVGFGKDRVMAELGDNCVYVIQETQKGTGHAVLCAKDTIKAKNLIVLYGDMPFVGADSIRRLVHLHESNNAKVSMFTAIVPHFENEYEPFKGFGRILRDDNDHIAKIREYADCNNEQKQIIEINPGIYMFDSAWLWPHLEQIGSNNVQGEVYLTDIIEIAIKDGQKIENLPIAPEEIYGINTPEHLAHAETLITQ